MMRKEDYDEKVDVYSYGVILWELVARKEFLGHISFLSAIEGLYLNIFGQLVFFLISHVI